MPALTGTLIISFAKQLQNSDKQINKIKIQLKSSINQCLLRKLIIILAIVNEGENFCEYDICALDSKDIVIQKGIIRKIFEKLAGKLRDIEAKHVTEVLSLGKKQVGKLLNLPYGMIALKKYGIVRISIESNIDNLVNRSKSNSGIYKPIIPVEIEIPGRIYLDQIGGYVDTEIINYEKNKTIPKNSCIKWFDYDKIENTLLIRTRKAGDFLQINSQGGRKKLKDYLIDLKIPKEDRDRLLLVADGNHILWIVGYDNRISEKFKISDNTKNILSMILIYAKEKEDDR